jgi:carbon storage regulator
MLVLSRRRDETIMIGDDIEITIVDIRGDRVRLGITAPATIPVHRKEVYDAIQRENREAARMKMENIGNPPKAGQPSVPPGLHKPAVPLASPAVPQPQQSPSAPPPPIAKKIVEIDPSNPAEASAIINDAVREVRDEAKKAQTGGEGNPSKLTPGNRIMPATVAHAWTGYYQRPVCVKPFPE